VQGAQSIPPTHTHTLIITIFLNWISLTLPKLALILLSRFVDSVERVGGEISL